MEHKELSTNGLAELFSAWEASQQGEGFSRLVQSAGQHAPEESVASPPVDKSQGHSLGAEGISDPSSAFASLMAQSLTR